MKIKKSELKQGDVFHANWKEREWGDQKSHCFEGLFIVKEDEEGEKWFVDTFWGVNKWDNKKWKYTDAIRTFNLEYYVNVNEIEPISEYLTDEYEDVDLFALHDQHSCAPSCRYLFVRKGAKKSPTKKIKALEEEIRENKSKIEWAVRNIEQVTTTIEKIRTSGLE